MKSKNKNAVRQHALITGATSGFGYEFANLFAQQGFNLVLVARADGKLHELARELATKYNVDVTPLAKDLFDPKAAEEIYIETKNKGLQIDVLVNDAGQGEYGKFVEYDLSRDIDVIQLNIIALVSLTKYFLSDMVKRNEGRILQIASLLSKYPSPWMVVYGATKAFVLSFTEGLINELKDTGVTMTALLPGPADTDFFHKAGAENTKIYREQSLSSPKDVAKDGFDALMNGESKIVSGFKNKVQAAISNVVPDDKLANTMREQMNPSHKAIGREDITHPASKEERDRIEQATGSKDGDYERAD